METALRIDHGPSSGTAMSYTQRQPTHRQNHTQQDLYKPSRSPLPPTPSRYPFPGSPQLQSQVVVGQLAPPPPQQQPQPTLPPSNSQPPQQQQQAAQQPQQRYSIATAPAPQPSLPPPTGYRDTYRQHRISLLHPDYGGRSREVLLQGSGGGAAAAAASAHHMDSSMTAMGQQPFKKIRLQDHNDFQPLRIDTREPGAYNPQVEAISPTFPDHIQQEDQAFRTTKDELLQQIGKVDREIAKTESQISILRKKMQELEESASKPSTKQEVEEDCQPKHQSLAQKIYAENRKKAQSAHSTLDSLGAKVEWPIYNQPSDAPVYLENKRKQLAYKRRLLEYFKKRHVEKDTRNSHLIVTYSKMMQEWHRKVDKTESSSKRKTKEAKNREFFEKVFPELRKQREDKERFNRVGARIKSEADMEEIMDNLQEQVLEDKKMRSYAVIPPIMLDGKERKNVYQNNNGHILDMEAVHKSRQFLNIWTAAEKEIFKEKYLQHPKNFYLIASCLDKKSVADCVQYYYLSKKTENYKQLLKRSRQRTRHRPQKTNTGVDNLPPGVVTRHQKEQQALKTVQQSYESVDNNIVTTASSTSGVTVGGITTFTVSSTNNGNNDNNTNNNSSTALTPTSNSVTSSSSSPAPASTPSTVISNSNGSSATNVTAANIAASVVVKTEVLESCGEEIKSDTNVSEKKLLQDIIVKVENTSSNEGSNSDAVGAVTIVKKEDVKDEMVPVKKEEIVVKKEDGVTENYGSDQNFTPNTVVENKKKKERRKDKDNCQVETSEDESVDLIDKSSQGQCIVCGAQLGSQLQSRPLAPNQASLYGLREDQIPPNGRVCNTCRCKSVRSRYTHCPLPTCPNARGRVKRLRSFPQRLQELPQDVRDQLLAEFHVPSGVTKCCSACFNRIQRRLGLVEDWPEEEVNQLRNILSEVGANWQLVGERMNKTAQQVRSFYASNRKRLELESCLGDRKPTLTDEEESGSSTSSCEEPLRERHSSDTVSAESPPVNHEQPANPARKEDYDSSATETADEGQTPDHYQGTATITPVNPDGQTRQNTSPLTVKDLMLNVIERSLKKPSGPQQPQLLLSSGMAPTISSILNDSNEVTIVSEYNLNNQPPRSQRNEISIAKLTPLIGATITAVQVPPQATPVVQEPQNRDDLVVMQVQDGREPENLTLDLSIKKNRELPPPAHAKHQQIRPELYMYHERKSPAVYASRVLQPKLPSPKPANPKAGSITMGTPIVNQPRYDGLLRQITPDPKMGSITQGTPIHVPGHIQDKRMYEYFGKRPTQNVPPPQNANFAAQYRQPYSVEQQLSRQIIMNDYITSQQMEKLGRRSEKPYYLTTSPQHRTPPPAAQQTQQRQGVIQRHTRPHYPLPGHEALTSLVDVAVQQPSLPVPTAPHEGLGKTIADNILEQPHRFQMMQQQQIRQQQQQQQQQQQRIEVERRYHHQQQQVRQQQAARNESSTLTAANLIDAIITHQINQSESAREVVSNSREPPRASDRLFQSFHREQPQPDNNGERSPSVISVDLDSDPVNKNLTVKELTDSVISHDFNTRQPYYTHQESLNEQWKRRLQQREEKRSGTPQQPPQSQDERQIIRIAQPQKYPVEPVSPPENNHWQEQNYRRYPQQTQPQPHISALDYVKNRIVEVMRTEDDKKDTHSAHDRSDSPGEMVIDEEKHENEFQPQPHQPQSGFTYNYVKDNSTANDNARNEPEPLLDSKYEPLSDED